MKNKSNINKFQGNIKISCFEKVNYWKFKLIPGISRLPTEYPAVPAIYDPPRPTP